MPPRRQPWEKWTFGPQEFCPECVGAEISLSQNHSPYLAATFPINDSLGLGFFSEIRPPFWPQKSFNILDISRSVSNLNVLFLFVLNHLRLEDGRVVVTNHPRRERRIPDLGLCKDQINLFERFARCL